MTEQGTPNEQRFSAEIWQGHGFGDYCEWTEPDPKLFGRGSRIKKVADSAAVILEQFLSQEGRAPIRTFDEPDSKFSAWEHLPGTIVRVDLKRLYSPAGTTQIFAENSPFLGVTVRMNAESERDPELKIAVAKQMNYGARRGIVFDFMDPEIVIGRVDHKKERRKNRRQDSYETYQDMILVGSVQLLALGKREDPRGGKRKRVPSIISVFQRQQKPA